MISIVIPSYNSETTIIPCLRSVVNQQVNRRYEVIVVDSSFDGTPNIVRRLFPEVKLIHLEQKVDTGKAKSIGIQRSKGNIVCLLDSDCIAHPDWLYRIYEAHRGEYAAVGGAILNANPENLIGWAGYFAEFREWFPFHPRQIMSHIAGCNLSYKRWVFDKYGMFPRNYYPQSDLVYNLQLNKHNDQILFDPAIKVAHINKTSIVDFVRHQYRIGRTTSKVLKQFPNLRGGWIAKSRFLTSLTFPLLPCVKFVNAFRVANQSKEYKYRFLVISPLLLLGLLFAWETGFIIGAFYPDSTDESS